MSFLVAAVSAVTGMNRTDLEKKLDEALSKANWGAPNTLLREIAAATHEYSDYPVVMREVWESLNHAGKNWRQIFKGLTLLDVLIKHGSERVVDDARDHLFRIRTLTDFTHHEDGSDKGTGVREKAKQLVELLNDNLRIREEREAARQHRGKFVGISSAGAGVDAAFAGISGGGSSGRGGSERSQTMRSGGGGGGGDSHVSHPPRAHQPAPEVHRAEDRGPGAGGASAGRRGRRPAGGGGGPTVADPPPPSAAAAASFATFDDFAPAAGAGTRGGGHSAGFEDFGAPAPAPPPTRSEPPAPAPSGGRLQVNIRPSALPSAAAALRPPPAAAKQAPAPVPPSAPAPDDFGLFEEAPPPARPSAAADWSDFTSAPPAPAAAPARAVSAAAEWSDFASAAPPPAPAAAAYDPFSAPPASATPQKPNAAAVLAAAYDPFSSPPPAAAGYTAAAATSGGRDPFAPGPSHSAAGATTSAAARAADDFGGFAAAPGARDDDVDRLFSGGLSLGGPSSSSGGPSAASAARPVDATSKKAVPLAALAAQKPVSGAAPSTGMAGAGPMGGARPILGGASGGVAAAGPYTQGQFGGWPQPAPGMPMPLQQPQQPQFGGWPGQPQQQQPFPGGGAFPGGTGSAAFGGGGFPF